MEDTKRHRHQREKKKKSFILAKETEMEEMLSYTISDKFSNKRKLPACDASKPITRRAQLVTVRVGPSFEESNLAICIRRPKNARNFVPDNTILGTHHKKICF